LDQFTLPAGFRIVSGGQAGADRAALDWAIAHAVPHGGWCPKGRRAEDGRIPARYDLTETPSANYLQRTQWNVRDSDVTLIVTLHDQLTAGSRKTVDFAVKLGKPWLHFDSVTEPERAVRFLNRHGVRTLNVAGSRASSGPGIRERVLAILDAVIAVPSKWR